MIDEFKNITFLFILIISFVSAKDSQEIEIPQNSSSLQQTTIDVVQGFSAKKEIPSGDKKLKKIHGQRTSILLISHSLIKRKYGGFKLLEGKSLLQTKTKYLIFDARQFIFSSIFPFHNFW